jgi:transposase-like protein
MDRRTKVELFEEIRQEYTQGAGTIQGVSKKLGVHRRMVRQALACATPQERKQPLRSCPSLGPVKNFIDEILAADERAPKKQRHTARRLWKRIHEERLQASVG